MEKKLKDIITKQFGVLEETITLNTNIVADLNADSLDSMELVIAIENQFSIKIEENEYKNCDTVEKILSLIESKTQLKH